MATGMKTIGNGTAYGDWIRLDQQVQAGFVALQRLDGRTERRRVDRPEEPGPWAFPPFASAVTAGGRLLMAALERLLADGGGLFASGNTDSATVVSTRDGGLVACPGGPDHLDDRSAAVRAISWAALDAIRARFSTLNVELRLTNENFNGGERRQPHAVGVAGSRVILYTDRPTGRVVVKRSEVALGDLRSPLGRGTSRTFVDESAEWMLSHLLDERPVAPGWFPLPATTDLPMGTPAKVRSLGANGSPYGFAMGARRARRAAGVFGGEPVRLIAPAGDDPVLARWMEVPSGAPITVVTPGTRRGGKIPQPVEIASYGEELVRLVLHPESKMLGPDGRSCKVGTKGLLVPRPVRVAAVHLVGKEGNRLEEVATGEVIDPDEVLIDYGDDEWEGIVLPLGRAMGTRRLQRATGLALSHVVDLLHERAWPRPSTKALLTNKVTLWAATENGIPTATVFRQPPATMAACLATEKASTRVPVIGPTGDHCEKRAAGPPSGASRAQPAAVRSLCH
jgi:hypothetical protein